MFVMLYLDEFVIVVDVPLITLSQEMIGAG